MLDDKLLKMCEEESLSVWNAVLLMLIYHEHKSMLERIYDDSFMDYSTRISMLEKKGLVKQFGKNASEVMLRERGKQISRKYFGKRGSRAKEVDVWIEQWRNLFPPGANNVGFRYRGNKLEVKKKMIKFVDSYDFTKEEIFEATKQYVNRFELKGYSYMQQAHYFIEKQGVGSSLASECETLRENRNKPKEEKNNRGYGRNFI